MRTIRTKVYKFNELSNDAKDAAIESLYDINVDNNWWDFTYDDAENIGLKIKSFDIDRASYVNAEFTLAANEVAQNIFRDHGESCETYKTAQSFMNEWQLVFSEYMNENSDKYESAESEDKLQELENEFLKSLCEDYRIILSKEYDYLTSKEAITETIEANEYEFYSNGKLIQIN
jgi:hypothetical protein